MSHYYSNNNGSLVDRNLAMCILVFRVPNGLEYGFLWNHLIGKCVFRICSQLKDWPLSLKSLMRKHVTNWLAHSTPPSNFPSCQESLVASTSNLETVEWWTVWSQYLKLQKALFREKFCREKLTYWKGGKSISLFSLCQLNTWWVWLG